MDLIVQIIDEMISERIKLALGDDNWGGKDDTKLKVIKERLRRVLVENISTGSENSADICNSAPWVRQAI